MTLPGLLTVKNRPMTAAARTGTKYTHSTPDSPPSSPLTNSGTRVERKSRRESRARSLFHLTPFKALTIATLRYGTGTTLRE